MEPSVQYAQTADGVSIAFWTYGSGPPILQLPSANISPTRRAWRTDEGRAWYEGLANGRTLVRYDNRGFGDSEHGITAFPDDYQLLDIETVVDRLGLEQFALFGYIFTGPVAIAYAARHPERVSHLILWCTSAREADLTSVSAEALEALRRTDFDLYVETMALVTFGWSQADQARTYAQALKESLSPEALEALGQQPLLDSTALLSQVRAPTLVLHRRGVQAPTADAARKVAAHIPNSRYVTLDGDSAIPYVGDVGAVLRAVDDFLGKPDAEPAATAAPSGMVTILFTDIEDSTNLTQRLGDAKAQELVRTHNNIVRDALRAHAGSEIKHTGDGIMSSFSTASAALDCAIAIQRAVSASDEPALAVHIGINAGEPVAEEDDLFGTSVQLARRICDHAEGAEILASNVVREIAAGKGFLFSDRGATALRGFEDPVQVWEVRWREE
ncbi:MAG: adenylate/guanylate cyclase domain-containing protein [Dehalococcoidia bacterium]